MDTPMTTTIDPVTITLAAALRLQFGDEPAALRAIDRAVDHLSAGIPYTFDGVELRVTSWSRRAQGAIQVCEADVCTCESARRPFCWHRMAFRLLFCQAAMQAPNVLRAKILEQCEPAFTDAILDEVPRVRQIDPAAGATFARLTADLDEYFTN